MLFDQSDIAPWEDALAQYDEALQHHAARKNDDSLVTLDHWYQDTLPDLLSTRKPNKFIDSRELCKFRPSLAKLAASNADADVKRVSQKAFNLVDSDLRAAITQMAELKGVGPATASAILCAGAPEEVPFMADETMDSVPGLGAIAYTIPYYLRFATKVIEKAAQLKKKGSSVVNSPHLVEKALWADYMLEKYGVERKVASSTSSKSRAKTQVGKDHVSSKPSNKKETGSGSDNNGSSDGKRKADTDAVQEEEESATPTGKKVKTRTTAVTPTKTSISTRSTRSRA
ncbi:hypothetical protein EDD11_003115 [Mortierella claussenii]|nr:hypothetical protein EDD11_003115 [Mortierella claussenii]